MVNESDVTQIVCPQAGHLASLQGWLLLDTMLTALGNFLCIVHTHLQADASWMFGVGIVMETFDNASYVTSIVLSSSSIDSAFSS